jgi:hypothetical protein
MDFLDPPRDLYMRPGTHHPRPQPNQNGNLRRSDLSGLRRLVGCGVRGNLCFSCLFDALESEKADDEQISLMLTKDYSKRIFGIDYPLLVLADENFDSLRYYAKPLSIRGKQYPLS